MIKEQQCSTVKEIMKKYKKNIRNCGAKSEREIMEHLFLYQYNILPPDEQNEYLKQVAELNKK